MFKLFWNQKISFLLILCFLGCASTGIKGEFFGTYYLEGHHNVNYYPDRTNVFLTDGAALKKIAGKFEKSNSSEKTREMANDFFNIFCQSKTQKTNIKEFVKYILPKTPTGIPLDLASEYRKDSIEEGRLEIRRFFQGDLPYDSARSGTKEEIENDDYYWRNRRFRRFFALASNNSIQVTDSFKSSIFLPRRSDKTFIFVKFSDELNNKTIILMTPRYSSAIVEYTDSMAGQGHYGVSWRAPQTMEAHGSDAIGYYGPIGPPGGLYFIAPSVSMKTNERGDEIVYPLGSLILFEIALFKSNFTMLIPREVQETAGLVAEKVIDTSGEHKWENNYYGLDHSGNISISKALGSFGRLWHKYIDVFTTVKESPTDDPQIIDFEVSLDLNLFCQYGRHKSDLTSK